eukprot:GFUD01042496.1.p1 GENE.GFUD01042496.1~~GFUD01042496.1.p1  ORF type:complete len:572 (-),score=175.95 GFUD01042496.1:146-1861(-)
MSLTPQRVRTEAPSTTTKSLMKAGNWSKCFPTKFSTETSSCVFVKKLLTVAVSNITYLRGMFPEMAYANRSMDGLALKILKGKNECPEAQSLANWLMGAFDALEKKYLRELMLVVYEDPTKPDVVQELYTFKFSYPDGQATCQLLQGKEGNEVKNINTDDIYRSTQSLLRTLIVLTQGLNNLPDCKMTMKLTYYDAVTPTDYEPAGFIPTPLVEHHLPSGAASLQSGQVDTDFHCVQLNVKAVAGQRGGQHGQQAEEAVQQINQEPVVFSPPPGQSQPPSSVSLLTAKSPSHPPSSVRSQLGTQTSQLSQGFSSVSLLSEQSELDNGIHCSCSNHHPDPLMLQCTYCSTLQHAACYRIVSADKIPAQHCCVTCSIAQGVTCTDSKLVKMSTKPAITHTCLFRRMLSLLCQVDAVTLHQVTERLGVELDTASAVLQKLTEEGCLVVEGEDWVVQRESLLSTLLPKYLGIKKKQGTSSATKEERVIEIQINAGGKATANDLPVVIVGDGAGDTAVEDGQQVSVEVKSSVVAQPYQIARNEGKRSLVTDRDVKEGNVRVSKRKKVSAVKGSLNI